MVCEGRLAGKQRHSVIHSLPLVGIVCCTLALASCWRHTWDLFFPCDHVYHVPTPGKSLHSSKGTPSCNSNELYTKNVVLVTFLFANMYIPLSYLISLSHITINNIPYQNPDLRNIRNLCFAILFREFWVASAHVCNFRSTWTIMHSWVSTVAILFT